MGINFVTETLGYKYHSHFAYSITSTCFLCSLHFSHLPVLNQDTIYSLTCCQYSYTSTNCNFMDFSERRTNHNLLMFALWLFGPINFPSRCCNVNFNPNPKHSGCYLNSSLQVSAVNSTFLFKCLRITSEMFQNGDCGNGHRAFTKSSLCVSLSVIKKDVKSIMSS